MKDQLTRYIDLLFAGAPEAAEIKQEILQNTLDRYDDLLNQGKSPEAAYRLAISGIGDINEILGGSPQPSIAPAPQPEAPSSRLLRNILRACAVALYIICPLPVILLQDEWGVCFLLLLVAIATALLTVIGKGRPEAHSPSQADTVTAQRKKDFGPLWLCATVIYLALSFATRAWYITWIIFPIAAVLQGIIRAGMDLKEAQ